MVSVCYKQRTPMWLTTWGFFLMQNPFKYGYLVFAGNGFQLGYDKAYKTG